MRNINVVLTKAFFGQDLEILQNNIAANVNIITPDAFTPDAVLQVVDENTDVLVGEMSTPEIFEKAVNLKLMQIPWTGVDRLPFELLKKYNITVCNTHSNSTPVAEYAFSLMLSAIKQIPFHDKELRKGNWKRPQRDNPDSFIPPFALQNSTVLFVGYGAIGKKIAAYLTPFNTTNIAIDANEYDSLPDNLHEVASPDKLMEKIPVADIIFLCIPLTPSTKNLFNAEKFAAMKKNAFVINTSRGEVIDEEALFNALNDKQIAGAAVDTWYNYPKPGATETFPSARFPFHSLDNLVMSPHRAGFIYGDLPHLAGAIENINRVANGEQPLNKVDLDKGY